MTKALSVAICVPGDLIERWQEEFVAWALAHPDLAAWVVVSDSLAAGGERVGRLARSAYERLDARVFGSPGGPLQARSTAEWSQEVEGAIASDPAAEVTVQLTGAPLPEVAAVKNEGARWQLWVGASSGPSATWLRPDFAAGAPTFTVRVETLAGQSVATSICGLDPVSLYRNRAAAAARSAELLQDALERALAGVAAPPPPADRDSRLPERPRPRLRQFPVGALLSGADRTLRRDQWSILWRPGDSHDAPWDRLSQPLEAWNHLVPPADRMYADPMAITRDGRHYLFLEEFGYSDLRGVISVCWIQADGTVSPPVTIMDSPHHLSYPFLVEAEGDVLMVPECAESERVDAYRFVDFPTRLEHAGTLLEGVKALDPTLHEIDGRWWMWLTTQNEARTAGDQTRLYSANHPLGPWSPHLQNPIVSDIRFARPAGPLFRHDGRIVRPVQDGSERYGRRLHFMHVIELSDKLYREAPLATVESAPLGAEGIHTYSHTAGIDAVDIVTRQLARRPGPGRRG